MKLIYIVISAILLALVIAWILGIAKLPVWQAYDALASDLRDFRDTAELEWFLELGKMTVLRPDPCKENVDQFIKASALNGYRVERFRITSLDYYKFWYNYDPQWQPNEGHGIALVKAAGRDYLIEPSIPMAWELTQGYAGVKVGVAWE